MGEGPRGVGGREGACVRIQSQWRGVACRRRRVLLSLRLGEVMEDEDWGREEIKQAEGRGVVMLGKIHDSLLSTLRSGTKKPGGRQTKGASGGGGVPHTGNKIPKDQMPKGLSFQAQLPELPTYGSSDSEEEDGRVGPTHTTPAPADRKGTVGRQGGGEGGGGGERGPGRGGGDSVAMGPIPESQRQAHHQGNAPDQTRQVVASFCWSVGELFRNTMARPSPLHHIAPATAELTRLSCDQGTPVHALLGSAYNVLQQLVTNMKALEAEGAFAHHASERKLGVEGPGGPKGRSRAGNSGSGAAAGVGDNSPSIKGGSNVVHVYNYHTQVFTLPTDPAPPPPRPQPDSGVRPSGHADHSSNSPQTFGSMRSKNAAGSFVANNAGSPSYSAASPRIAARKRQGPGMGEGSPSQRQQGHHPSHRSGLFIEGGMHDDVVVMDPSSQRKQKRAKGLEQSLARSMGEKEVLSKSLQMDADTSMATGWGSMASPQRAKPAW